MKQNRESINGSSYIKSLMTKIAVQFTGESKDYSTYYATVTGYPSSRKQS